MEINLLYQVSHYIRVQKQRNIKRLGPAKLPCYKEGFVISESELFIMSRHETLKNQKKRKIATCEGAQRPNLPGGGFGRGVPPPAENFAILGTDNHVLKQTKINIRGKLLHVRERSDRTSWGWVREGGSPLPQKILQF